MRETYSATITEIDELGGAENSVSTSTIVCDRCGRQRRKAELIEDNGFMVCDSCVDD